MIGVIVASILCAIGGQISLKAGMNRIGRVSRTAVPWRRGAGLIFRGLALYGLSTVLWLYTLSRVELSYAFPFLSLSYVGIVIAARFGLDERIEGHRLVGSVLIVAGVILVSLS